jgi:hypothetical protein
MVGFVNFWHRNDVNDTGTIAPAGKVCFNRSLPALCVEYSTGRNW